ncbi:MAG TPA: hypothetical protein VKD66_16525 [Streptosporangiaceae bacterium]|nr:hypothetical protein [Streptosporangiaceae bacterium]
MMPYDTYRLHQAERAKSPAELQCADERAARLASAVSSLFRAITRPVRAAGGPHPAAGRAGASRLAEPAACRGAMAG